MDNRFLNFFFGPAAITLLVALAAGFFSGARPAAAELQLSFYLANNHSPNSKADYDFDQGAGEQSTNVKWTGENLKMPPNFGVRGIWWLDRHPNLGFGIDNVHAKIAADPPPEGFRDLEFTDGINMITANVHYRWLNQTRYIPYLGLGIGITTPHVEVRNDDGSSEMFRYQFGGGSAQALIGLEGRINDRWSAFGEFKMAQWFLDVDLEDDGWFKTDASGGIFALGVSYTFGRR